jgi:hypothetical protein
MRDLAALTAKTGDEFLMLTRRGRRLIMRGGPSGFAWVITPELARAMAAQGWRLSGHTHPHIPGFSSRETTEASVDDALMLAEFGMRQGVVFNSLGDHQRFYRREGL